MPIPGLLLFLELLCQPDADLHTVDEAGAFVVTAEGADWIDDSVHLPQWHAVHQFVQFVEILLDLVVVHQIDFVVCFVEHIQDGLGRLIRELLFCQVASQLLNVSFHDGTS